MLVTFAGLPFEIYATQVEMLEGIFNGFLLSCVEFRKTFSIGTGFPFRKKMGMVDVALSYSLIGDLAKNDRESKVWRGTISVSGLEKWW